VRPSISISSLGPRLRTNIVWLIVAIVLGASVVFALPPFSTPLVLPIGFGGLFYLTASKGRKRAFLTGWAFGFGFFLFGLSWIAESFFVDAERFGWMAAPAVIALAGGLALFPAAAMVVFAATKTTGVSGALVFAACWSGSEWLRGTILTGFPWNLIAYAWAALFGSYGLGLLTVLLSTLPTVIFTRDRWQSGLAATMFVTLAAGIWINGEARLTGEDQQTAVNVRIVQGNIPQREKWDPALRDRNIARYLDLSAQPGQFDILLWPESTFPGYLEEDQWMLGEIAKLLTDSAVLLTGAQTRENVDGEQQYKNAVLAIDSTAQVINRYAKHHLVPFGEYVPLRDLLPLRRLTAGLGDFTPGPGPETFRMPQLPGVGLSICYEAIFPGKIINSTERPEWIFNATNDAWFGASIGPNQHLASSRMRAVEEGLPFIRAANTGISAIIDGKGRIVSSLSLGETEILDGTLPAALAPTAFSSYGQVMFWLVFAASLTMAAILNFKKDSVS
jgi:apolipoprotein N-acyltransferase